jgi:hypothetical protein
MWKMKRSYLNLATVHNQACSMFRMLAVAAVNLKNAMFLKQHSRNILQGACDRWFWEILLKVCNETWFEKSDLTAVFFKTTWSPRISEHSVGANRWFGLLLFLWLQLNSRSTFVASLFSLSPSAAASCLRHPPTEPQLITFQRMKNQMPAFKCSMPLRLLYKVQHTFPAVRDPTFLSQSGCPANRVWMLRKQNGRLSSSLPCAG